jgi:hypothetical protein
MTPQKPEGELPAISDHTKNSHRPYLPRHAHYVVISSVLTILVILLAIYLLFFARLQPDRLSAVGQIISGLAAVIAFIWFIQSFLYQYRSILLQYEGLRAQLNELALQRKVLVDTSAAANTNLYIIIFDHSIHSLNRFCRSLVVLCMPESQTEVDSAYPFSLIQIIEADPQSVFENPASKSLLDEYVRQYHYLTALAAQFGCSELFNHLMKNSPHKHICGLSEAYYPDQTL